MTSPKIYTTTKNLGLEVDAKQKKVRATVLKAILDELPENATTQVDVLKRKKAMSALSPRAKENFINTVATVADRFGVKIAVNHGKKGRGCRAQILAAKEGIKPFVLITQA